MSKLAFLLAASLVACSDDSSIEQPDVIALPGDAYYPESISASKDGTLFVGSLATGQVLAFDDGSTVGRVVVGPGSGVTAVSGVLVHDKTLWLCSVDTMFMRPTEVRSFTLAGEPRGTYSLGDGRFCNDLAFDKTGNLYVTDSFSGTVLRLTPGGAALEPWLVDPALAPGMPGAFGLDGIVFDGDGALYLNRFDGDGLYKVAIATKAVTAIAVTPALVLPDGMRKIDRDSLLLVEGAGRLTRVDISGTTATATALAELDQPTSLVQARGTTWVTEGQLGRLFGGEAPVLPFAIRRVDL